MNVSVKPLTMITVDEGDYCWIQPSRLRLGSGRTERVSAVSVIHVEASNTADYYTDDRIELNFTNMDQGDNVSDCSSCVYI